MEHKKIDRITDLERKYVSEVLDTEFRSSKGSQMMRQLESEFSSRFGSRFGISFVNGTSTMHASLEAFGVGEGDEVIVPPLTMSATTFAVLQANATPVFADVDKDTFQICPDSIRSRLTERTKAIITVALYGLSPDMDPIMEIADEFGLKVIEDNAECFLGKYKGRIAGTIGHCASFSFQSSKHLTSGEGGMVLTDDEELAGKIRKVQSLGYAGVSATKGKISKIDIQHPSYSRHVSMGWNYRMPELCCAVALAQTQRIDELVEARVRAAQIFEEHTAKFSEWFRPQFVGDEYKNSYWTWVTVLDREDVSWDSLRDRYLELGGDGVYGAWKLTYQEPMFQELNLLGREKYISESNRALYRERPCPNAEWVQPRLFQFKTNYWNSADAEKNAEILRRTLAEFA